ncbi:MAG: SDR family oxidoreductase [Acidobacteriota bacterium]|nr:MAG: SDR family oxidoreductase [Acidobacteriota bacterium]
MSDRIRDKKVAVISGATGGLGSELCREFVRGGFEVVGLYLRNDAAAAELQRDLGAGAVLLRQDITVEDDWRGLEVLLKERSGSEFTVIANASAQFIPKPFHLLDPADFEELYRVNVVGAVRLLGKVLPRMIRGKRGRFVGVLSSAMEPPSKGFAAYAAAKSALRSLTRSISLEYGERGIRSFSVSPGFMETPLTDRWSDHLRASLDRKESREPSEVARRICELVNDPDAGLKGEDHRV